MTIQVRKSTYRQLDGWTVSGYPPEPFRKVFPVKIFTLTESSARHIARKVELGWDITAADFDV